MNLFVLDKCPIQAARWNNDRHCVKICLEAAQVLCTAFNLQGIESPYKTTHKNHPVSIWVRKSLKNFKWAVDHGKELCFEYERRYKKVHKCLDVIKWCEDHCNMLDFEQKEMTPFAQAMPDDSKSNDAVDAYRTYYMKHKRHLAQWKMNKPDWYV